jgi:hypothetical protein
MSFLLGVLSGLKGGCDVIPINTMLPQNALENTLGMAHVFWLPVALLPISKARAHQGNWKPQFSKIAFTCFPGVPSSWYYRGTGISDGRNAVHVGRGKSGRATESKRGKFLKSKFITQFQNKFIYNKLSGLVDKNVDWQADDQQFKTNRKRLE